MRIGRYAPDWMVVLTDMRVFNSLIVAILGFAAF